jgi:hypothetical protein
VSGRLALVSLFGLVAARFAVMGLLESVMLATRMLYRPLAWWEGWPFFLAELVVGGVIAGTCAAWVAQRRAVERVGPSLLLGAFGAGVVALGHFWSLSQGFFAVAFADLPGRGNFPYPPGSTQVHMRGSGVVYEGHARIGEDGRRACAPEGEVQQGELTVTLLGDSFVYGLGVDDPDTLCWRAREHFAARAPGRYRFATTSKPGASLHTYRWMVEFTQREFPTDLLVIGLLLPNDAEVLDVLGNRAVVESRLFQVAASVLHPETLLSLLLSLQKVGKAEFFDHLSIVTGIERLAETVARERVPTLIYLYDYPSRNHAERGELQPYVDLIDRIAEQNPWVELAGVVSDPAGSDGTRYRIPGDGHPTPEGHAHTMVQLAPKLEAFLRAHGGER